MDASTGLSCGGRTFYIDGENNPDMLLIGLDALDPQDLVVFFHRDNLPKATREMLESSPTPVRWVLCEDPGIKNSLDFQLVAELSLQLHGSPNENSGAHSPRKGVFIISQDKGFIPAANHLNRSLFEAHGVVEVHPSISSALGSCAVEAARMLAEDATPSASCSALSLALGQHAGNKAVRLACQDRAERRTYASVTL